LTDANTDKSELNIKDLLQPKELFLRLYILRGHKLSPKDDDGLSDPYLIIKIGKTTINLRDRRIENTLNPEFYEAIEIPVTIPGDSRLEITCMDWDGIGDDFIGSTVIDIEDRWFCKEWRKLRMFIIIQASLMW
jgi:Ca2+-dependent lipid-binding protein